MEHVIRGFRIEIAGRLVGEQKPRHVGDRARDRDPLLLAAGEFSRPVRQAFGQAEVDNNSLARLYAFGTPEAADHLRQHDVLDRRELRHR
jgi:hypothetical protein